MRRHAGLIQVIAISGCLFGCASKRINPMYTENQIKAFRQMAIVDPVLNLWELGSSSQSQASNLIEPTRVHFRSYLESFVKRTDSQFYSADSLSASDRDSLIATFDSAFFNKQIDIVKIPDNLLKIGKEDNILFLYFNGYYKTGERQRKEFWKSLWIGLATLGTIIPVYYPGAGELYSVLIDKKNKRLVYTDRVIALDDFRSENVINGLLDKSINKFYVVK